MKCEIQSIALGELVAHPDNPNEMSGANFAKLVRNIKRTGRYEPLVVRCCPQRINRGERKERREKDRDSKLENKKGDSTNSSSPAVKAASCFQIINGEHRCRALAKLGYEEADCIVWDVDDEQTDILLGTLNRLCGADKLDRKIKLLERSNRRMKSAELAKLLPQTAKQIERLTDLKLPKLPAKVSPCAFANPMVFFVTEKQQRVIEEALLLAVRGDCSQTEARRRATGLAVMAEDFISKSGRTFER